MTIILKKNCYPPKKIIPEGICVAYPSAGFDYLHSLSCRSSLHANGHEKRLDTYRPNTGHFRMATKL